LFINFVEIFTEFLLFAVIFRSKLECGPMPNVMAVLN